MKPSHVHAPRALNECQFATGYTSGVFVSDENISFQDDGRGRATLLARWLGISILAVFACYAIAVMTASTVN